MPKLTKQQKVDLVKADLTVGFGTWQRVMEILLSDFLRSALSGEVDYLILDSKTTVSGLCDLWITYRGISPQARRRILREEIPAEQERKLAIATS